MRFFVYEHACAAAVDRFLSPSLRIEGWAMLSALVEDLAQIPGVEVFTTLNEDYECDLTGTVVQRVNQANAERIFDDVVGSSDFSLVIAPELNDILRQLCCRVEDLGGTLLGPSSAAVGLCADKLALARHLTRHGVRTPECQALNTDDTDLSRIRFPAVVKPRYGAGSLATFLVRHASELQAASRQAKSEGWHGESVLQPFVPGQAVSVAFLLGPKQRVPLVPASQNLSDDGRFHYLGGWLPLSGAFADRAISLACRAIDVVPGLKGYVGVDLVLGDQSDDSQAWVIEINPRLTTSYVGLRALSKTNLAEAMMRIFLGEDLHALSWRTGSVRFGADGNTSYSDL